MGRRRRFADAQPGDVIQDDQRVVAGASEKAAHAESCAVKMSLTAGEHSVKGEAARLSQHFSNCRKLADRDPCVRRCTEIDAII